MGSWVLTSSNQTFLLLLLMSENVKITDIYGT